MMSTKILRRIEDRQECKIIMAFLENRGWDFEGDDLLEFLCETYEDYEEYREWFLMMVA